MNWFKCFGAGLLVCIAWGAQAHEADKSPARSADTVSGASAVAPTDAAAPSAATPLVVPQDGAVTVTEHFDNPPVDWKPYVGRWELHKDGNNSVFMQAASDSGYRAYPRVLWKRARYSDVDVTVRFKPVSGEIDASGGIIFRAQDENNYYVARANAREDNLRLYTVIDGDRKPPIASTRVAKPAMGQWHTLRIVAVGDHIQVYLDGSLMIDHRDDTYSAGWVGLWTKSDAVTEFDDVKVTGIPVSGS